MPFPVRYLRDGDSVFVEWSDGHIMLMGSSRFVKAGVGAIKKLEKVEAHKRKNGKRVGKYRRKKRRC
jgi:hypothetical protein